MESEGSITVSLDACREDSILIETVKDMVDENSHAELENEEQSFFVVSNVNSEQQNVMDISNEETVVMQSNEQFSWSTLCRVCANTSDHLIPIFEGEGLQHDLCNKIHKYLPIHISEDDTLPLQLCYHCAATLLAWHELLDGCLSAERRLLEMYDESLDKQSSKELETSLQDTPISIAESFQQQQETVKDEVPEELTIIDSGRYDAKHENVSNDSRDNERTERPSKTDLSVNKESEAASKTRKKRSKRSLQQRDELARSKITWNGSTYYRCGDCKKILSTSYNFLIHLNTHTGEKPYVCHYCDKSFCSASALNRHVRDVHAGLKKFVCDVCDLRLASKASRDEHRRTHTGEKPHVCEQCGKSFAQKASLHVHKSYHLQVHPYECSWCKRCFKRKQELDKHVFIHTKQRPYPCNVCGKRFRSKGCVSRHKRVHSNKKLYSCVSCNAQFAQERWKIEPRENESTNAEEVQIDYIQCTQCDTLFEDMKFFINHMNTEHEAEVHYCQYCRSMYQCQEKKFQEHVSMHDCKFKDGQKDESVKIANKLSEDDAENPPCFTCNTCDKNFTKKSELKKHISKHSYKRRDQNPEEVELVNKAKQTIDDRVSYKCDTCQKIIFTKRGFLRHIRVHSNKRPCKCDLCGKSYRIEQDLARHIRDVHEGLKKYACDICGRAFANKGAKDDHRRIHTGERPYTCEHCPKKFRTLNSIYIHNRVHTDYKPHECSYCGKHFRSRQRLTHHETTHTGIKAFACDVCGKTFSVKGEVVRHRATHNMEKPYDCECGMKFGQKRYLRNHVKLRHPWLLAELLGKND